MQAPDDHISDSRSLGPDLVRGQMPAPRFPLDAGACAADLTGDDARRRHQRKTSAGKVSLIAI
jgi:hypothetical protein